MKQRNASDFDRSNGLASEVILADVSKYGGPGSALARWARLWQQRHGSHHEATPASAGKASRGGQLDLFESEAA